jgi:hypothetical protein
MAVTVLYAAMWPLALLVAWPRTEGDSQVAAGLIVTTTLLYLMFLAIAAGFVIADRREKRSGGQPPRPGLATTTCRSPRVRDF